MNFISAVKKRNFSLFLQGKQGSDTIKAHLIQDALLLPGSKKGARILHSSAGLRIDVTKQPSRTENGQRITANGQRTADSGQRITEILRLPQKKRS